MIDRGVASSTITVPLAVVGSTSHIHGVSKYLEANGDYIVMSVLKHTYVTSAILGVEIHKGNYWYPTKIYFYGLFVQAGGNDPEAIQSSCFDGSRENW